MTTSPDITETLSLLRELVSAFVAHPEALDFKHQAAADGSVYFAMRVHPDDEGRCVGAGGCHVNALAFLVQEMGAKLGHSWTFMLVTENEARDRTASVPRRAFDFRPDPVISLVGRLLGRIARHSFGIYLDAGSGPRVHLSYVLSLRMDDREDRAAVNREIPLLTTEREGRASVEMNVLAAVGTMLRAIAKHQGVRLHIQLEPLAAAPQDVQAGNY